MTDRLCSDCRTTKPIDAFRVVRGIPRSRCLACTEARAANLQADKEALASGQRRCRKCNIVKPTTEFSARTGSGRAPGATHAQCKSCIVVYGKNHYRANKEFFASRADENVAKLIASGAGRKCIKCNRNLPLEAFSRDILAVDGLRHRCNECVLARKRERRASDDRLKEADATYARRHHLRRYGIDQDIFVAILESQDQKCRACRTPLVKLDPRDVQIDHDHATGAVRGILCWACNLTLGAAKDNPERLQALVAYLNFNTATRAPPPGSSVDVWRAYLDVTKHLP